RFLFSLHDFSSSYSSKVGISEFECGCHDLGSSLRQAIGMGSWNFSNEAMGTQQAKIAARSTTGGASLARALVGAGGQQPANVRVAESLQAKLALEQTSEQGRFLRGDRAQAAVGTTVFDDALADRIQDPMDGLRYFHVGQRLEVALISGMANLHQPRQVGHS